MRSDESFCYTSKTGSRRTFDDKSQCDIATETPGTQRHGIQVGTVVMREPLQLPCAKISLATRLLALILGPKKTNTHGTTVNSALTPPSRLDAPGVPRRLNIASVNSGKIAARM